MITLVIATCLTATLTDCKETQRVAMPASTTMVGCNQVARALISDEVGHLVIKEEYKRVTCENS